MSTLDAKSVKLIKEFVDRKSEIFDCDCDGYMEYDTNAFIHGKHCASGMEDHCEIVLTRLVEWLEQNGPIQVRGW